MPLPAPYTLTIGPLRALAPVGVHPTERKIGRVLAVTVTLKFDKAPEVISGESEITDALRSVPDYAELSARLNNILGASYQLVETYAARMLASVQSFAPDASGICVVVRKERPFTGNDLEAAEVKLCWSASNE